MKFPHVTPKMAIGGVLGVIAVALGIQVYRTHDESSGSSGGTRSENGRGQYGHGRKRRHDDDGDEGGDDDHHEKKHKKQHKKKHR